MAISQPVPPQKPKKAGLGCLGCGCLFIVIVFLGFLGFCAFGTYLGYKNLSAVTSAEAEQIPPYAVTEDVYDGAQKKIASFQQDVAAARTSTLTLSADEINALIHHEPDLDKLRAQEEISLEGDTVQILGTVPTNSIPVINLAIKDRYINLDATANLTFNSDTKEIGVVLHKFQLGDFNAPQSALPSYQAGLSQVINQRLKANPDIEKVLQAATNVSIQNGQFVIETK